MKAFVFSMIAVSFMMLLIFLAAATATGYAEMERSFIDPQAVSYASSTMGNVGRQFSLILLPDASVTDGNGTVFIRIADSIPRPATSSAINEFNSFVANNLSTMVHANITTNISKVNGSSLEILAADKFFYRNGLNGTSEMFFGKLPSGATGVRSYSINITVDDYRASESLFIWNPLGDINVTVYYFDYNGTGLSQGKLKSDATNSLTLGYGNASRLILDIGEININGSYSDGAVRMNLTNGLSANYVLVAELPAQPSNASSNLVFQIPMTYSQDGIYKAINASR